MLDRLRYWLSAKLCDLGHWVKPEYRGPDFAELLEAYLMEEGFSSNLASEAEEHNALLRSLRK